MFGHGLTRNISKLRYFKLNARLYLILLALGGVVFGIYILHNNFYILGLGYEDPSPGRLLTVNKGVGTLPAGFTAVESAEQQSSTSGYGNYLDALPYSSRIPNVDLTPRVYFPWITGPADNGQEFVLVGAGDIAECSGHDDEKTAALLDSIPGTVFAAGDTVYNSGTAEQYQNCYEPSWGRHKFRTRPAVGNHEYLTPGAAGYYSYFGAAAGDPDKGYYSYDLGEWHIVVLNSNCSKVGGCDAGSPQVQWLRQDLAQHPTTCTLAYWHHPRFSSGQHGSNSDYQDFWQALYDYDADVILNGHDHDYERFGPQDPDGKADPGRGIRQIVVGTGGKSLRPIGQLVANSEVANGETFGVLKMTLYDSGYHWEFIPAEGSSFTDSGSDNCH